MLANMLNTDFVCHGTPAASWWITYKDCQRLENKLSNAKIIIFCHTHPARILTENLNILQCDYRAKSKNEEQAAGSLYMKYIHNHEVHDWSMSAWFKELNERYKQATVLHLFAFDDSMSLGKYLTNGIKAKTSLTELSLLEFSSDDINLLSGDSRANHFSQYNNKILAKQIYNGLINGIDFDFDKSEFNFGT